MVKSKLIVRKLLMAKQKLYVPILLATGRNERKSEIVASYTFEQAKEYGFGSCVVDVRNHMLDRTIPGWQDPEPSKVWREIMEKADGLIIVVPEYNHSFPGEFKIVFDQLFKEYKKKPVSICAVSSGGFGGTRMVEQIWTVTLAAQMVPTSYAVHFSNVSELFDNNGRMIEPKIDERMQKMLEETEWYARVLKRGREEDFVK